MRRLSGESADGRPYAAEREIEDIEALINGAGGQAAADVVAPGLIAFLRG